MTSEIFNSYHINREHRYSVLLFLLPQQHRLQLFSIQRRFCCLGNPRHIRFQRLRFFQRIILTKGDKKDISPSHELQNISAAGTQPVVGGHRNEHRALISQLCLCRHGHHGIRDAACQLTQGISGAGSNNQQVQQPLGTDWLRFFYAYQRLPAAQTHDPLSMRLCCSKPCVC